MARLSPRLMSVGQVETAGRSVELEMIGHLCKAAVGGDGSGVLGVRLQRREGRAPGMGSRQQLRSEERKRMRWPRRWPSGCLETN